jgi:hypothetical protein
MKRLEVITMSHWTELNTTSFAVSFEKNPTHSMLPFEGWRDPQKQIIKNV